MVTGWAPPFGASAEILRATEERTLSYVLGLRNVFTFVSLRGSWKTYGGRADIEAGDAVRLAFSCSQL